MDVEDAMIAKELHEEGQGDQPQDELQSLCGMYCNTWTAKARDARLALEHRQAADTRPVGDQDQLSLVLEGDIQAGTARAHYINWMSPATLVGQIAIERLGEVVFSMVIGQHAKPFRSWQGCTVIHNAVGVRMMKRKKGEGRQSFPTEVMKLMEMIRLGLTARSGLDAIDLGRCNLCKLATAADLTVCVICTMTHHLECSRIASVSQFAPEIRFPLRPLLPRILSDVVDMDDDRRHICDLCAKWMS